VELLSPDVFDSPAVTIICGLEADGFRVELTAAGVLVIAPRSRLTPERMAEITTHKEAVRLLVRACDAGVLARREVFEQDLARTPAPGIPRFLFIAGLPYVAGRCFSCADALHAARFGRCWRCALAWRLAARVPISPDLGAAFDSAKVIG
jgi:hypothetical protein